MNIIKRVRKWRTDKILAWVKPGKRKYTIVVYRRINPRYEFEGGDFDGVNEFRFIAMDYARTRLGALIVQMFFGRDSWSDGLRQQKVVIFPPDYGREIFRDVLAPATYPFEFDGYPEYNATYGVARTAETEGDLYESITGHRSAALDNDDSKLSTLDKYEQAEQVGKDFRTALVGPRLPGCLDDGDSIFTPKLGKLLGVDADKPIRTISDDPADDLPAKFTDTKLFSDYDNE